MLLKVFIKYSVYRSQISRAKKQGYNNWEYSLLTSSSVSTTRSQVETHQHDPEEGSCESIFHYVEEDVNRTPPTTHHLSLLWII